MAPLIDITTPRRGSKRRQLLLDGEPWLTTAADVITRLGVATGDDVDPADLADRISSTEGVSARERAIRLLTYRERSAFELSARLVEDGYSEACASAVVSDLQRLGLVDDERFANMLARNLTLVRGLGRSRATRELAKAGIDPGLAAAALDEALPPDAEAEAAMRLARTAAAKSGATVDRVAGRLIRRGYRPGVALSAAREAMQEVSAGALDDGYGQGCDDADEDGLSTP